MSYSYQNAGSQMMSLRGLGVDAACTAAAAAAKESSRVAATMVRARGLKWSVKKDQQIAQLRRDWSTGTGESFGDMMARWQAKAAADAAVSKAAAAIAATSVRVAGTMVRTRGLGGSAAKTKQIAQLRRDWGTPNESYDAMTSRWQAKASADTAAAKAPAAAAKESNRVYQAMVSVYKMRGSPEKTRKIGELLRSWSTGTGESYDAMTSRWQAKAKDDADAAKACGVAPPAADPGTADPGGGAAADPGGGAPADPGADAGGGAATPGGLPIWAWGAIGAGVLALVGGAVVVRKMRKKKAPAALPAK
jgi:hypothetical protein